MTSFFLLSLFPVYQEDEFAFFEDRGVVGTGPDLAAVVVVVPVAAMWKLDADRLAAGAEVSEDGYVLAVYRVEEVASWSLIS